VTFPISSYDAVMRTAMSNLLYACLPSSKVIGLRNNDSNLTFNGSWSNMPTNVAPIGIAISGNTPNTYVQGNVVGRYVAVSFIVAHNQTYTNHTNVSLWINGTQVDTMAQILVDSIPWYNQLWIYDTGSVAGTTQQIKVKIEAITGGIMENVYIEYFAGFDQSQGGCNPVFVMPIPSYNFNIRRFLNSDKPQMTQQNRDTFNDAYEQVSRTFRKIYRLPIYYMKGVADYNPVGHCSMGDYLHPNVAGHRFIADSVVQVLTSGALDDAMNVL
jgi:hypothetical protein